MMSEQVKCASNRSGHFGVERVRQKGKRKMTSVKKKHGFEVKFRMLTRYRLKVPWYAMTLAMFLIGVAMLPVTGLCALGAGLYGYADLFRIIHIGILFALYWLVGYLYPHFAEENANLTLCFPVAVTIFWFLLVLNRNLPALSNYHYPSFEWSLRFMVGAANQLYSGFATIFDDVYYLLWDSLPYSLGRFFDLLLLLLLPCGGTWLLLKGARTRKRHVREIFKEIFTPHDN